MTVARSRFQRCSPSNSKNGRTSLRPGPRPTHKHPLAHGLDDDRSVTVAVLEGEFVHANHLQPIEIDRAELTLQACEVRRPKKTPAIAGVFSKAD